MRRFKKAVQDVALAALKRGYKKNELDRVWGKFLAQWWKAQEVRRGELRAWFRRMLRVIQWKVWQEPGEVGSSRACKFQGECRYKDLHCPFVHPVMAKGERRAASRGCPPTAMEAEEAIARAGRQGHVDKENIPKTEAIIKEARGDGACLFYCLLGDNDNVRAQAMRMQVAQFVERHLDRRLGTSTITMKEALAQRGLMPRACIQSIMLPSTHGGELEPFFISEMQQRQVRVFMDQGEHFGEVAHFGSKGELTRVLYRPRSTEAVPHYDILQMKESWVLQAAQQQVEEEHRKQKSKETDRAPVKSTEQQRQERVESRAKQYVDRTKEGRKTKTQESREMPTLEVVEEEEEQETPKLLLELADRETQVYCICQRPHSARDYYIQCMLSQG